MSSLKQFLAANPEGHVTVKCHCCKSAKLKQFIAEFAAMIAAEKTTPGQSWRWFHTEFLAKANNLHVGYAAMMQHVRNHLGRQ